jgi:hypothetical protein
VSSYGTSCGRAAPCILHQPTTALFGGAHPVR